MSKNKSREKRYLHLIQNRWHRYLWLQMRSHERCIGYLRRQGLGFGFYVIRNADQCRKMLMGRIDRP